MDSVGRRSKWGGARKRVDRGGEGVGRVKTRRDEPYGRKTTTCVRGSGSHPLSRLARAQSKTSTVRAAFQRTALSSPVNTKRHFGMVSMLKASWYVVPKVAAKRFAGMAVGNPS